MKLTSEKQKKALAKHYKLHPEAFEELRRSCEIYCRISGDPANPYECLVQTYGLAGFGAKNDEEVGKGLGVTNGTVHLNRKVAIQLLKLGWKNNYKSKSVARRVEKIKRAALKQEEEIMTKGEKQEMEAASVGKTELPQVEMTEKRALVYGALMGEATEKDGHLEIVGPGTICKKCGADWRPYDQIKWLNKFGILKLVGGKGRSQIFRVERVEVIIKEEPRKEVEPRTIETQKEALPSPDSLKGFIDHLGAEISKEEARIREAKEVIQEATENTGKLQSSLDLARSFAESIRR